MVIPPQHKTLPYANRNTSFFLSFFLSAQATPFCVATVPEGTLEFSFNAEENGVNQETYSGCSIVDISVNIDFAGLTQAFGDVIVR